MVVVVRVGVVVESVDGAGGFAWAGERGCEGAHGG